MKKVLILCTGNSCRSIMAEALINHYLGDSWQAFSAGVAPSSVHPLSIRVLQELGIDTTGLRSKHVSEFIARDDPDLVITVCDHAKESCPVFPRPVQSVHLAIKDPDHHPTESDDLILPRFRQTLDSIENMFLPYLSEH